MLVTHWWRALQVLVPIIVFAYLWTHIPSPTIEHSQAWLDARANQAAYQYDPTTVDGKLAIQALMESAAEVAEAECAKISAIADPYDRIKAMSQAEVRLEGMVSKHPMWPGIVGQNLFEDIRTAAGLGNGFQNIDLATMKVAQDHTELLSARFNEEARLVQEYGIGFTEPLSLRAPYYMSWIWRWVYLFLLSGLAGAVVLGCKLKSFGYNWKDVAENEFGSAIMGLIMAPVANLILIDAYESQNPVQDRVHVNTHFESADVLKLSFSFRAAVVMGIAGFIANFFGGLQPAMAAESDPIIIQETTYLNGDGGASNELRFVVPTGGSCALQFDYNLRSGDDLNWDFAVRGPFRPVGPAKVQPRLVTLFNNEGFAGIKLQTFSLFGTTQHPASLFSSWKLPKEGRASVFNELEVRLFDTDSFTCQAIINEFHLAGESAGWKAGPKVTIPLGRGQLNVHYAFGLGGGGPGDECMIQYFVPVN